MFCNTLHLRICHISILCYIGVANVKVFARSKTFFFSHKKISSRLFIRTTSIWFRVFFIFSLLTGVGNRISKAYTCQLDGGTKSLHFLFVLHSAFFKLKSLFSFKILLLFFFKIFFSLKVSIWNTKISLICGSISFVLVLQKLWKLLLKIFLFFLYIF